MIYLAYDHGGYNLANKIKKFFVDNDIEFQAVATEDYNDADDFTDFSFYANDKIIKSVKNKGIYICRNGVGMCMVANRNKGIRAVNANNPLLAKQAREHHNANVLCLGGDYISYSKAIKIVKTFLETPFLGGRYLRRVKKLESDKFADLNIKVK